MKSTFLWFKKYVSTWYIYIYLSTFASAWAGAEVVDLRLRGSANTSYVLNRCPRVTTLVWLSVSSSTTSHFLYLSVLSRVWRVSGPILGFLFIVALSKRIFSLNNKKQKQKMGGSYTICLLIFKNFRTIKNFWTQILVILSLMQAKYIHKCHISSNSFYG